MRRDRTFLTTVTTVFALAAAWLVAAAPSAQQQQVVVGGIPPQRDPNATVQVRMVPVGTATITGTVTAAAGGRAVRDARVSITGVAIVPEGATPASAGPAPTVGVGRGGAAVIGGRGGSGETMSLSRSVVTDAGGNFTFAKLPAGHFTLNVQTTNFLQTSYGQKRAGGQGATIVLGDGQRLIANMALVRGGVITGTISDDNGEPVVRAQVSAWRYTLFNGVRRLSQSGGASTDDRGVYRLTDLQPGDYMVGATLNSFDMQAVVRMNPDAAVEQAIATGAVRPPSAPGLPSTVMVPIPQPPNPVDFNSLPTFLPTYHPGTPVRGNATMIHVTGGDEHPAVDITAQPVPAGSIQGTISTPLKQGVSVRMSLISNDPAAENNFGASLDQNGKFTFRTLAPGQYIVMAQTIAAPAPITIVNGVSRAGGPAPQLQDDDRLWGSTSANVEGGSQTAVSIVLRPGRSISGVVLFDMAKPPDLTRTRLTVSPVIAPGVTFSAGPLPQAQVEPDGRFSIHGVLPGRYSLRVGAAGGTMKSSIVGNVDTLDFPLDFQGTTDISDAVLTLTDKLNELSGTLTESSGKPGMDYTVIAATVEDRFWTPGSRRVVVSRSGADGKYLFRSLPPGDYYLVIVSDLEQGMQYDPEFLKSLAGVATRVTVTEGGKTTQDLRVR